MKAKDVTKSPTRQRILEILQDGQVHPKSDLLMECPNGPNDSALTLHLFCLRKNLRDIDPELDIVRVYDEDEYGYQLVRKVPVKLVELTLK